MKDRTWFKAGVDILGGRVRKATFGKTMIALMDAASTVADVEDGWDYEEFGPRCLHVNSVAAQLCMERAGL